MATMVFGEPKVRTPGLLLFWSLIKDIGDGDCFYRCKVYPGVLYRSGLLNYSYYQP